MNEFFSPEITAFLQVVMIDLVLAGDNAIVIGLAAAGLPKEQRNKAILIGVIAATVLRRAVRAGTWADLPIELLGPDLLVGPISAQGRAVDQAVDWSGSQLPLGDTGSKGASAPLRPEEKRQKMPFTA